MKKMKFLKSAALAATLSLLAVGLAACDQPATQSAAAPTTPPAAAPPSATLRVPSLAGHESPASRGHETAFGLHETGGNVLTQTQNDHK